MSSLGQRESRNSQFDFLRPNHSLFPYFMKMVEQYSKILAPPRGIEGSLKTVADNKFSVMQSVKNRVEYAKYIEQETKKQAEEADKERGM